VGNTAKNHTLKIAQATRTHDDRLDALAAGHCQYALGGIAMLDGAFQTLHIIRKRLIAGGIQNILGYRSFVEIFRWSLDVLYFGESLEARGDLLIGHHVQQSDASILAFRKCASHFQRAKRVLGPIDGNKYLFGHSHASDFDFSTTATQ
jgi:hypothetical protein